jgi:hypothetical protein
MPAFSPPHAVVQSKQPVDAWPREQTRARVTALVAGAHRCILLARVAGERMRMWQRQS